MKLGFVTSILEGWSFAETIDIAAAMGYECVEVACWPTGSGTRRYAGVSHIDAAGLDEKKANEIVAYCKEKKVYISSLAYYPNVLDANHEASENNIRHLYKVIDASAMLSVNLVTTFIGRDQFKTAEDNFETAGRVWTPILNYAQDRGVKIAIENCPMLFGADQWPGGQNLMTSPANWRKLFEILPHQNFGINYDPSHFVWQMMDYIAPLYEFKNKIFHVHFKDIKLYQDKLRDVGVLAYPLDFMAPKLPGLGDVDWGKYTSALTDIGYDGSACVEVEDREFESSRERVLDSLRLSYRYLHQFVI